ncbi:unnamed protein product, partial [Eretmochelys imbricata]
MPSVVRSARRLLELPWKPGFQAGVAAAQGGQRQHEGQQDLLQVVEGQPVPAVGEAQPAERLAGRRGRRAGWPGRRRPRGARRGSARSGGAAGRGQRAGAGHAEGGEEEGAGAHVEHGGGEHQAAERAPAGPAEVQRRVGGPEGQGQRELQSLPGDECQQRRRDAVSKM